MHYKSRRGGGTSYSENEQRIGTFLGKPLYRKVMLVNGKGGVEQIDTTSLNIENLVCISAICTDVQGNKLTVPYNNGVATNLFGYIDYLNKIRFNIPTDYKNIYVWIEYTKTTDSKSGGVIKYLKRLANTLKRGC